jgi:HK97 gp10 family phage protein
MIDVKMTGVDQVRDFLKDYAPKEAVKLLNNTMRAVTVEYKKEIQRRAPTHRTLNLKKSLTVKKRKAPKFEPRFSVVFSQGRKAKRDGFYWRFVEYGTVKTRAQPFVEPSISAMIPKTDALVGEMFTKKLQARFKKNLKIIAKAKK